MSGVVSPGKISLGVGALMFLKLYLDKKEQDLAKVEEGLNEVDPEDHLNVYDIQQHPKRWEWDAVVDVCCVGTGASACTAALAARYAGPPGLSIVALEKDEETLGGTTAKSGGVFWIPNNPLMQESGLVDDREDCIKFLCRVSYPDEFNSESQDCYGLEPLHYDKIVNYYDTGYRMIQEFVDRDVMPNLAPCTKLNGENLVDYAYSEESQPDNKAPEGRALGVGSPAFVRFLIKGIAAITGILSPLTTPLGEHFPSLKDINLLNNFGIDLSYGLGIALVDRLTKAMRSEGIEIKLGHSVEIVYTKTIDDIPVVVGVGVRKKEDGSLLRIGVRRGVIFGTGGFSMNKRLLGQHLPGDIYQTAACKNGHGDAVVFAQKLGAEFEYMDKVWGCESLLEESLTMPWESHTGLLQMRGDAFFVVNAKGKRVYNEKSGYDKRVRVHWNDPENCKFLFMVGDERCVAECGSNFAKQWPADLSSPLYVTGETTSDLYHNLKDRIRILSSKTNISRDYLSEDFLENFQDTLDKFNDFAEAGKDLDFGRGDMISDRQWTVAPNNNYPNPCLRPLTPGAKLYCVIIAASLLDTKGGPKVTLHGQPLLQDGERQPKQEDEGDEAGIDAVIPGIYFVGNCGSPISGGGLESYWSGGATLGSCLVSGWTAGIHCSTQTRNCEEDRPNYSSKL